ncbi:hypothetical protein J8281_09305 [Aquimarina sp. U1-2]|uniref:hypothetical protein n=1 Tax=Aquimarina sp. U1-2 TaxID=2823141 RepID=UPI001AEC7A4D|nr:hypothetical protein [Aquimarina sp. U1-2]MBP2832381.1 hypothetical protein [Aquimarina sp. U1-2]
MPANPKHLSSNSQRIVKITAGILGGYLVTILFHNSIGSLLSEKAGLLITSAYSSFFLWSILLIVPFLFKNGWKAWATYIIIILICAGIIFINK